MVPEIPQCQSDIISVLIPSNLHDTWLDPLDFFIAHKQEAHTHTHMYEKSVQQVEPEDAAFHLPSSSMCCDSCPSNSFLIRVTGRLSHSMCEGEKRRGERTRFFITNRCLHVPHLHTVRKVISKDFLFFFFSTSPLTD